MAPKKNFSVDALVQSAPSHLLEQLRRIVAPVGKKGSWMKHLSDSQLLECYYRLERGDAAYKVAQIAIEQWGQMQGSTPRSLSRTVRAFKESSLNALQLERLNNPAATEEISALENKAAKLGERFSAMERLEKTIILQGERIDLIYEKEKKSLPFSFTHKELQVQADLIDRYLKWSKELGIIQTTPQRLDMNVSHTFNALVSNLGDSKTKLIDSTSRFVELIKKESIDCEMGPDGKFNLVPKPKKPEEKE